MNLGVFLGKRPNRKYQPTGEFEPPASFILCYLSPKITGTLPFPPMIMILALGEPATFTGQENLEKAKEGVLYTIWKKGYGNLVSVKK